MLNKVTVLDGGRITSFLERAKLVGYFGLTLQVTSVSLFNNKVERNGRAFDNKLNSIHRIKLNFLYDLWSWSFVFMSQGPSFLVDFLDWLGSSLGTLMFMLCLGIVCFYFDHFLSVVYLCTSGHSFWGLSLINFFLCLTKEKCWCIKYASVDIPTWMLVSWIWPVLHFDPGLPTHALISASRKGTTSSTQIFLYT